MTIFAVSAIVATLTHHGSSVAGSKKFDWSVPLEGNDINNNNNNNNNNNRDLQMCTSIDASAVSEPSVVYNFDTRVAVTVEESNHPMGLDKQIPVFAEIQTLANTDFTVILDTLNVNGAFRLNLGVESLVSESGGTVFTENASFLYLSKGILTDATNAMIGEVGSFSVKGTGCYTMSNLLGNYVNPVIIMKVVSTSGDTPAVVKVGNIQADTFDFEL